MGIAIGGVVDLTLEQRRESAALRQTRRLVAEDLFLVCVHLDHLVRSRSFPRGMGPDDTPLFPNRVWLDYRAVLAMGLDDKEFLLLSRVSALLSYIRVDIADGPPASPLHDSADRFDSILEVVTNHKDVRGLP